MDLSDPADNLFIGLHNKRTYKTDITTLWNTYTIINKQKQQNKTNKTKTAKQHKSYPIHTKREKKIQI